MSYTKIEWKDAPSTSTPVNASNLNKMDEQIFTNTSNIETLITDVEKIVMVSSLPSTTDAKTLYLVTS